MGEYGMHAFMRPGPAKTYSKGLLWLVARLGWYSVIAFEKVDFQR